MDADKMNESKRKYRKSRTLNKVNTKMEKIRKMFRKLKILNDDLNRNTSETVALEFINELTHEWIKNKNYVEKTLNELTYESMAEVADKIGKVRKILVEKWNGKVKIELEDMFYNLQEVEERVIDELRADEYIKMACMIHGKVIECIYAEMFGYDGLNKTEFMASKREELLKAAKRMEDLIKITYEEEFGN